ncbi:hypothetical protein LTR62_006483 [Meristemomyces frigidus]|uniref:Uncharacterized protein n=1 Tax=Meristemomyces frigidus TaxID=1508187 RepID=A0AAN7TE42_9PEZI|nr:hypothetical protein LTR62_006483 [Meristemomyces frigidus]
MVYHMPISSYTQMIEDARQARLQSPTMGEQLPAYSEAIKGQARIEVIEKKGSRQQTQQQPKSSAKISTLRSILTGETHKHHLRNLDAIATAQATALERQTKHSTPKPKTSSQSTIKSLLTGETHKTHLRHLDAIACAKAAALETQSKDCQSKSANQSSKAKGSSLTTVPQAEVSQLKI